MANQLSILYTLSGVLHIITEVCVLISLGVPSFNGKLLADVNIDVDIIFGKG